MIPATLAHSREDVPLVDCLELKGVQARSHEGLASAADELGDDALGGHLEQSPELEAHQLDPASTRNVRKPRSSGSRAGRSCGGTGSATRSRRCSYAYANASTAPRPRSFDRRDRRGTGSAAPAGVEGSEMYEQVTSTASPGTGAAGSEAPRGKAAPRQAEATWRLPRLVELAPHQPKRSSGGGPHPAHRPRALASAAATRNIPDTRQNRLLRRAGQVPHSLIRLPR